MLIRRHLRRCCVPSPHARPAALQSLVRRDAGLSGFAQPPPGPPTQGCCRGADNADSLNHGFCTAAADVRRGAGAGPDTPLPKPATHAPPIAGGAECFCRIPVGEQADATRPAFPGRSEGGLFAPARVQHVPQSVAEQIEAQHDEENCQPGKNGEPWRLGQELLRRVQHRTP